MSRRIFFVVCLFPLWGIGGLYAQDTIRITWRSEPEAYMYTKELRVCTADSGQFTVDWGDGNITTVTRPYAPTIQTQLLHTYNNPYYKDTSYTVTIADLTPNIQITRLVCKSQKVSFLDISKCTKLERLDCSNNLLSVLDASGCTALQELRCFDNQLSVLDVGGCTALQELRCSNNLLSVLDISNCIVLLSLGCDNNLLTTLYINSNTNLEDFGCWNNQLSVLDISKNTKLKGLGCSNNQLGVLDISNNTALADLDCSDNRLHLSDLYNASEKIVHAFNKVLGTQRLLPQEFIVGESIDFSAQRRFGGIETVFTIEKDSLPTSDYAINNGIITFKDTGIFTVIMTNSAIISDPSYPAEVIVDIHVLPDVGIAEVTKENFIIYPNPTIGELIVKIAGQARNDMDKIEIYDVMGRNVGANLRVRPIDAETISIDISHLPSGIYVVKINTDKGIITKKFVKN